MSFQTLPLLDPWMNPMIRVVITAPPTEGRIPYTIETVGTRLAVPIEGLAPDPLFDACRHLIELVAAPLDAEIGLFSERGAQEWSLRTQVGYGAERTEVSTPGGVKFPLYHRPPPAPHQQRTVQVIVERVALNDETPARSEGPLLRQHRRLKRQAGKGPVEPEPATKAKSPRKRKPIKSASRRR